MKAKNVEDPKDKDQKDQNTEVQEKPQEDEKLLTPVEVEDAYKNINTRIDHFKKYSTDLVVESDEALIIAENNVAEVQTILKNIETVRKLRKAPYMEAGKAIDDYAKELAGPLAEIKDQITSVIGNYKKVQEAAKRAEAEKIRQEAEKKAKEQAEEADRIHRIQTQFNARIYGGSWFAQSGERKSSAGCINPDDCDKLSEIIKAKVPKPKDFTYLQNDYKEMLDKAKTLLAEHKANLINLNSESKPLREDAENQINEAKIRAGIKSQEEKKKMSDEIIDSAKKDIKSAEKQADEAGKGLRKVLKFEVIDFDKVPKEFLSVNETKVREWALEHKEQVKNSMNGEKTALEGIRFYFEETYVSR